MCRAGIGITETLDLDTVLRSVVDGACHGRVAILGTVGQLQHFVTFDRLPVALPGGLVFFEYLGGLPEPL